MKCLPSLLFLLLFAADAPADTYYLLSGCAGGTKFSSPYPFNPQPKLTQYLIEPGMWLVDDEGGLSPKQMQQTLTQLQETLATAKANYAVYLMTNQEAHLKPFLQYDSGLKPNAPLLTNGTQFLELMRRTNSAFQGAKAAPASLRLGAPGWEERLAQWKTAQGLTNPPPAVTTNAPATTNRTSL